jgi:hypothetical protein
MLIHTHTHHQTAGEYHYIKVAPIFFESSAKFRYLMAINQYIVHEDIKSRLNLGSA